MMTFTDPSPTYPPFFSGVIAEAFRFPEGRTTEDISAPVIEATGTTEMMSVLGANRQSPLESDFQKVGMAAGAGVGCGGGPVILAASKW